VEEGTSSNAGTEAEDDRAEDFFAQRFCAVRKTGAL
jgi:hypothetical protein